MGFFDRFTRRRDSAPRALASGTRSSIAKRADGLGGRWVNPVSGQGSALDRHSRTEFVPPDPLPNSTIDALLEFSGMARRIASREPRDATRRGFEIVGGYTKDEIERIETAHDQLRMLPRVATGRMWGKAYGGGAVIMVCDDGRPSWEPIDWSNLRSLKALRAVDRVELQVALWQEATDNPSHGMPLIYQLNGQFGDTGFIHRERVIPFFGSQLPLRTKIARNGWGGSELDLVWAELRNWLTSNDYAAEAITILSQGTFKVAGLADAIDDGDIAEVVARFEALRTGMGMLGDIAVDKDTEDYKLEGRSIAGLRDAVDALKTALVAATDMPEPILMGKTPGGLNSGENAGAIRSWYDHVAALQVEAYTQAVRRIDEVMLRSSNGPTQGRYTPRYLIEWLPLWEPTEGEKATTRLTNAQARAIDVNSGAVSADEVRQDPEFVEQYKIDPADPAPPPPAPVGGAPGAAAGAGDGGADVEDEAAAASMGVVATLSLPPAGESLIGFAEAGSRLGVGRGAIAGKAARKEIGAWKVGNRWRVAWSQVLGSLSAHGDSASVLPLDARRNR